jgi:hypothetical protein
MRSRAVPACVTFGFWSGLRTVTVPRVAVPAGPCGPGTRTTTDLGWRAEDLALMRVTVTLITG